MRHLIVVLTFTFFIHAKSDSLKVRVFYNTTDMVVRTFEMDLLNRIVHIYNKKNYPKLSVVFEQRNKPNAIWFHLNNKDSIEKYGLVCGLLSASITKNDPNYDFSHPYLPTQDVLIGRVDQNEPSEKKSYNLVHMRSNYYQPLVDSLSKHYSFSTHTTGSYSDAVNYFLTGNADYYLGDSIDSWVFQNRKVMLYLNDRITHFGFLYPKDSKLKKMFDPILKYYTKSSSFYKLLKFHFGKDLKNYYQKTMFDL